MTGWNDSRPDALRVSHGSRVDPGIKGVHPHVPAGFGSTNNGIGIGVYRVCVKDCGGPNGRGAGKVVLALRGIGLAQDVDLGSERRMSKGQPTVA